MAKQLSQKDAEQLLKQLQSLNASAKKIKADSSLKGAATKIEKSGDQLCKDNKDMPDA